jgi:glycosyltransferase involved in cell wall biosynthesis
MKFDLIDSFKISSNKIKVINNPLNKLVETNICYDFNLKEDYLFCIGRLEEQKNFKLAIESFEKLKNKYPNLRLKIAGIGSFKEKLLKMAKNLKVIDRVDFLGFISGDDLLNNYRKARLTLLTSLFEGFPNILIESLALGTPIVSVNCPSGPSEIIVNGVNGFLVDSYNSEDYVKAIIKGLEFDWDYKALINSVNKYHSEFIIKEYICNIEEITM